MGLDIRYSLRARQEELELLEYITREFGKPKAKEVYLRIERIIEEITEMPKMYRGSKKQKGLRKCVFSKQTSMYYRIQDNYIEIVSFRSNRINPKSYKI